MPLDTLPPTPAEHESARRAAALGAPTIRLAGEIRTGDVFASRGLIFLAAADAEVYPSAQLAVIPVSGGRRIEHTLARELLTWRA